MSTRSTRWGIRRGVLRDGRRQDRERHRSCARHVGELRRRARGQLGHVVARYRDEQPARRRRHFDAGPQGRTVGRQGRLPDRGRRGQAAMGLRSADASQHARRRDRERRCDLSRQDQR